MIGWPKTSPDESFAETFAGSRRKGTIDSIELLPLCAQSVHEDSIVNKKSEQDVATGSLFRIGGRNALCAPRNDRSLF